MIELRTAKPEEREAVAALWGQVFGDEADFLAGFYEKCAPYDETMVLAEDGVIGAILTAPVVGVRFPDGRAEKAGYMYALAADPAVRGRGFGRELMRFGAECLKEQGADWAVLVPAEPGLFRFFDRLNYTPAFSHLRREVRAGECSPVSSGDAIASATGAEYNALRRRWLEGRLYVDCPDGMVEFQKNVARESGGDLHRLTLPGGDGCAVVEMGEEGPVIKELLCARRDTERATALLCAAYPAERWTFRLPPWCGGEGERVVWGAVRRLHHRPPFRWPEETEGYLGIALD